MLILNSFIFNNNHSNGWRQKFQFLFFYNSDIMCIWYYYNDEKHGMNYTFRPGCCIDSISYYLYDQLHGADYEFSSISMIDAPHRVPALTKYTHYVHGVFHGVYYSKYHNETWNMICNYQYGVIRGTQYLWFDQNRLEQISIFKPGGRLIKKIKWRYNGELKSYLIRF